MAREQDTFQSSEVLSRNRLGIRQAISQSRRKSGALEPFLHFTLSTLYIDPSRDGHM
jgi:hypothetical protein